MRITYVCATCAAACTPTLTTTVPSPFSALYRDIHAPRDLLPELAAERHRGQELIVLTTNWGERITARHLPAPRHLNDCPILP